MLTRIARAHDPAVPRLTLAVISAISAAAPRLMTGSNSPPTCPVSGTSICPGNVTIACRPAHRTK